MDGARDETQARSVVEVDAELEAFERHLGTTEARLCRAHRELLAGAEEQTSSRALGAETDYRRWERIGYAGLGAFTVAIFALTYVLWPRA